MPRRAGAKGPSTELVRALQQVLPEHAPFAADSALKAVFVSGQLRQWRNELPQATSTANRVALTIDYLVPLHDDAGENALVLLLEEIASRLDPADARHSRLVELTRRLRAELAPPSADLPPCPYRGLLTFYEENATDFFGRESYTNRLEEAVRHQPLLTVVGASGSGKSSLVFAGLVPRLRQEKQWLVVSFHPGEQPFQAMARALFPYFDARADSYSAANRLAEQRNLAEKLESGAISLTDVIVETLDGDPDLWCVLLIVDQFEELYHRCPDVAVRHRFLDTLLAAMDQHPHQSVGCGRLTFVLTLRVDFLAQALTYRPFAEALQNHKDIKLGPMSRAELSEAIVKPAQPGVNFEQGLVERILDDVGQEPGNLPLLEFALEKLWARQVDGELTHLAYEQIGRVKGALESHAEEVYKGLSPTQKVQAKRVFVQLVQLGEDSQLDSQRLDTRRAVTRSEIGEADWSLVQELSGTLPGPIPTRLLTTNKRRDGQETVEVVHEALIREWRRLRDWVEESFERLRFSRRLERAAHEWHENGRHPDYLYRGARLQQTVSRMSEYQDWQFSELQEAFVEAGRLAVEQERQEARRKQEDARQNVRLSAVVTAVGGAVGLSLSGYLLYRLWLASNFALLFTAAMLVLGALIGLLYVPVFDWALSRIRPHRQLLSWIASGLIGCFAFAFALTSLISLTTPADFRVLALIGGIWGICAGVGRYRFLDRTHRGLPGLLVTAFLSGIVLGAVFELFLLLSPDFLGEGISQVPLALLVTVGALVPFSILMADYLTGVATQGE